MKIKVLGSSVCSAGEAQFASSYLVGPDVAIDAGTIGMISPIARQREIKHVFLSHAHCDHTASLPLFLDNVFEPAPDCPRVYGGAKVRDALQEHVFNDEIWPDLIRLSREENPFLDFSLLVNGKAVTAGDIQVTPIAVDHVVPTFGFVIEDEDSTVGIVSDTAPTEEIWRVLRGKKNLKAVFLEAAFPNRMTWLAEKSAHLTPALFQKEILKLGRDIPVIAVHIKPAFHDETVAELLALNLENLRIAEANRTYSLGSS